MGARINFTNRIWIGEKNWENGALQRIGYLEIDDEFLRAIVHNPIIKTVQIDQELSQDAYQRIDKILEVRPDICFRIYGLYGEEQIDISFLRSMKHLHRLSIDAVSLRDKQNMIDLSVLADLNLKSLTIECFDLRDYSFIKHLSTNLEELTIFADTVGPNVIFDCEWLLQYKKLHTLWLGKKAKKHIECLKEMQSLKSLSLRGIKITDFSFLKEMNLDKLALLWNSNNDLKYLENLISLKEIELWRINKLDDISFIEKLTNLEVIKLQDLKHIKSLPDLSRHKELKLLFLIDTGIQIDNLPDDIQTKVRKWDDRL